MTEAVTYTFSGPAVALGAWHRIEVVFDHRFGPRYVRIKRLWPRHYADAVETALHSSYRAKTRRRNRRRR